MWGDSHSADLVRSVRELLAPSGTYVLQANMGGCRPVLQAAGIDDICASFNAKTLALIGKYRPETVVLSAAWEDVDDYLPALHDTIVKVTALGAHVIVIGPSDDIRGSAP